MTRALLALLALAAACAPAAPPEGPAAAGAGEAELLGAGVLSTPANEYNPSLTPDGRMLVFARSGPDFQNPRILISHLRGGRWSAPEPAPWTDARYGDSDPTLTADGRTLYFISTRPAPGRDSTRADLDLWRVRRQGAGWGAPEHLGNEVNTRGQELGPAWHGGALYFASARRSGRGGLDLYRSVEREGRFGPAEALDRWNTPASESDPEFAQGGALFLFWSDRPGGSGQGDLWASRRTGEAWSAPEPLPGGANSAGFDFTPSLSPDGRWLLFASTRGDSTAGDPVRNGQSNLWRVRLPALR